jgi:hypothetical protein
VGEVYRVRDRKLNRDVALEILPVAFATDPERLARLTNVRMIAVLHKSATKKLEGALFKKASRQTKEAR